MKLLRDKVAVVTGAASGIGRALAERFAAERMKLALTDIDEPALQKLAGRLTSEGHEVLAMAGDVADREVVDAFARETFRRYGSVHVLCNNAGVTKHSGEAMWELTHEDWTWLVGVNLWGVIHGARAFLPTMIANGDEGHVVNTASLFGLAVGGGAYGVTKHAVVSFSENLLVDLRRRSAKIGVSCVCPAFVATDIVDSHKHRPDALRGTKPEAPEHRAFRERIAALTAKEGVSPERVADDVVRAIREESFYVFSDPLPERREELIRTRMEDILARRGPRRC